MTQDDERTLSPEDLAVDHIERDRLMYAIGTLKPKEQTVIVYRFGLGVKARTLQAIGDDLRLTRQRVLQIEKRALEKLRSKLGKEMNR